MLKVLTSKSTPLSESRYVCESLVEVQKLGDTSRSEPSATSELFHKDLELGLGTQKESSTWSDENCVLQNSIRLWRNGRYIVIAITRVRSWELFLCSGSVVQRLSVGRVQKLNRGHKCL